MNRLTRTFWRAWLDWTDRDIAQTWPFFNGPSPLVCLLPFLPNLIFAFVRVPYPVRLGVLDVTAFVSFTCLGFWVWRACKYFFDIRLPELRSHRDDR